MKESTIKIDPETGSKTLICYYNKQLSNFHEAIKQAYEDHCMEQGTVQVLCLPHRKDLQ